MSDVNPLLTAQPVLQPRRRFLRPGVLPTVFCPGCGGGTVLNCYTRAVEELGLDPTRLCSVTGIGCSSWVLSPYFKADTLHTTHGRAIAFATGVKVARPDLKVVVIAGDGDLSGIGGNHLIHAARRNIDLSVVMINNSIYGMTGGQVAPSTPTGVRSTTTPYGNPEPPIRAAELVATAGASYVARWTTFHLRQLLFSLETLLTHHGFGFVEVVGPCPTSFGKSVGRKTPADFMAYYRDHAVNVADAGDYLREAPDERIIVGTIVHRTDQPELTDQFEAMARRAQEREGVAP
jgi:2-oxoglutarate/2-oxoacid ferredoxin oxidoreductase subunit beta